MSVFTKEMLEAMVDERYAGGGIIDFLRPAAPITDTQYYIPRRMADEMRVELRHLEGERYSSAPEIQARVDIFKMRNVYVYDEPIYRRPRTGDMQQMIADIDAVQKTPATRHEDCKLRMAFVIRREIEKSRDNLILNAIRGRR